jgi:23S rRNA C2498 (ribose-2'-O)-methylase RlmM
LRERGLVADGSQRQAHVFLVDGMTAFVGTSDAATGARWPLGIPRLRFSR